MAALCAAAVVALGGVVGCFDGAAATGLPCKGDLDCGLADRCIDGFCGGPPVTSTTSTDPTSESSSGTDPGTSTGDSFCEGPPVGACTPLVQGQSDADCDRDCTFPSCGDGLHNENAVNIPEECDDGVQGVPKPSPTCDPDCTEPQCGDGYFNALAVAIEECEDANGEDFDECTNDCQVPLPTEPFTGWMSQPYDLSNYDDAGAEWDYDPRFPGPTVVTGWVSANGEWNSGETPHYTTVFEQDIQNYAGYTRLMGPAISLPIAPTGFHLELRFRHSLEVEADCVPGGNRHRGDGGVVRLIDLSADPTSVHKLVPDNLYPSTLVDECTKQNIAVLKPNPLVVAGDEPGAFTGESFTAQEVHMDLTPYAGREVQIAFDFGNDCIHCPNEDLGPAVWQIHEVIVAAFPD